MLSPIFFGILTGALRHVSVFGHAYSFFLTINASAVIPRKARDIIEFIRRVYFPANQLAVGACNMHNHNSFIVLIF